MTESQRWFAAVVMLSSGPPSGAAEVPLVDHQVLLIRAVDAEDAFRRAQELGSAAEHTYLNQLGDTVSWRFVGLYQLQELPEAPGDGVEVYSWFNKEGESVTPRSKAELDVFRMVGGS